MKVLMTIPGILSDQNDPSAWFRQFAAMFDEQPEQMGIPYSYFAGVLGGGISVDVMADEVAAIITRVQATAEPDSFDVMTHSHGAAILLAAMSRHPEARIRRWIGVASAAQCDCNANGINRIVAAEQAMEITLCQSPDDAVLAVAGGFPGYGQLGLMGPTNLSPLAAGITNVEIFNCDHCQYFSPPNLARVLDISGVT